MPNAQLQGYNAGAAHTPFMTSNTVVAPSATRTAPQANASEWDPFGPAPGSIPAVAGVGAEKGRAENKKWDPFIEEEHKATGPSGGGGANDTWADIQDSEVGGETDRQGESHSILLSCNNIWWGIGGCVMMSQMIQGYHICIIYLL